MGAKDQFDDEDLNASFYGGDTFDDMIAKVTDSTTIVDDLLGQLEPTKRKKDANDDDAVVRRESSSDGGDVGDDASLDSSDISGESTISVVSATAMKYQAPPLLNDDESTIDMRPPAPEVSTVSSYVDQLNQHEQSKAKLVKAGICAACIAVIVGVALAVFAATGNKVEGGISSQVTVSSGLPSPVNQNPSSAPIMIAVDAFPMDSIHLIQLTLQNLPDGPLPPDYRASIVSFIEVLLVECLGDSIFELLDVADVGGGGGTSRSLVLSRRLNFNLQLRIVVRGPSNYSEDDVRSYVMDVIKARSDDIVSYLEALDSDTFEYVAVSVGTFDITGLVVSPQTEVPTARRTTEPTVSPSKVPTAEPTIEVSLSTPSPSLSPETDLPTTNTPSLSPKTDLPTTNTPVTKSPTKKPSLRPTRNPIPRTIPGPTPTPLQMDGSMISPYGTATEPVGSPTTPSNGSVNQGPVIAPVSAGPSNGYFCAKTSYTENWNILLEFNCELQCPSMSHLDCPGGHQCSLSEYCGTHRG
jgi:hypothetical protein